MKKRAQRQQELKKQLKRKKRQRILIGFLCIVLIVGIIGGLFYKFYCSWSAGTFDIKHVEILGNENHETESIIDYAQVPMNEKIFTVDLNHISKNIRENMMPDVLRIYKKYPDTVIIDIQPADSICAMAVNDKIYYLNQTNHVVEISDYLTKSDIPLVSGFSGIDENTKVGDHINVQPDCKYSEALRMINALNNSGYANKISEIIISDKHQYKIITKNNVVFNFLNFDCFKQNYDYIGTVINKNYSNLEINLILDSNPIVVTR